MGGSGPLQTKVSFRVGDWVVDPPNNELRLGDRTMKLEPKVMDVLVFMAARPGQVVSREQLEDNVWAGRIVTYDALTATIVKLRKAFQTNSNQEPVIKTIPKRGYCLVAPVTMIAPETEPSITSDTTLLVPEVNQSQLEDEVIPIRTERPQHERRQITVVSCELTNITEQLDPEEQHALFSHFQQRCAEVIQQYGGHIVQYTNGQLVIYFGYPIAHEGDAERAIRTGLGIIDAVTNFSDDSTSSQKPLAVQVGIHSGQVVVGETGGGDLYERLSVVGDTPTIASALKNAAPPNTVVIGESTRRLVEHFFAFTSLAPIKMSESKSIQVFQIQNTFHTSNRFQAKLQEGLTPLVGREIEIDLLLKRWEQAKAGESQVVCLCADAGIGKSRILLGIQEHLQDEELNQILLFCSPYHMNSSLYPVTAYLEGMLGINANDDSEQSLDKLEAFLAGLGLIVRESAPVFAELLSLPIQHRYPDFKPRPQELKDSRMENLVLLYRAMAEHNPVLMIVEDTHWVDPTTRELIELLIRELNSQPILFITSYRPEFDPPWSGYMQATLLRLNRLSKNESAVLIKNVSRGKSLPDEVLDQIISRTDGVALFVEELTKSVLSAEALDNDKQKPISIPESLQDSLMARLDSLRYSKQTAQLASVLGRSFNLALLRAVTEEDMQQLEHSLDELVHAELIYKRGIPPDISYEFKHALVQNAAYQSLLKSTRQQFHQKIAEVLQQKFPQISKTQPEVLAHHYTEAQQTEQAVSYWLRAGQRSSEHSANIEAIAHLTKGLELVNTLTEGPERNIHELRLLLVLGPALLSAKGLGAHDAEKVYLRARELCREAGELVELFTVTWGLWLLCQKRGRLKEARAFASELLELAEKLADNEYHLQAHHAAWTTSFRLSDFQSCGAHADQGLKLYDAEAHRHHATRFGGHDPGVCAYYNSAMAQWLLGYADQARASIQQSVKLAERINHPFSQVLAHVFSAFIAQCCGDSAQAKTHSQNVLDLCRSHGIAPDCAAQARVLEGWIVTLTGDISNGIEMIEQAIIALRNTGVRTHEPYLLCVLAECYARADLVQDGLRILDDALNAIKETGERTFEAEVHRLKGELLLLDSKTNRNDAENYLQQAIRIANQQQARALELRTAMSLYRAAGKKQTPQQTDALSQLYSKFSEGHDTADLQAAARLLNQ